MVSNSLVGFPGIDGKISRAPKGKCAGTFQVSAHVTYDLVPLAKASHKAKPRVNERELLKDVDIGSHEQIEPSLQAIHQASEMDSQDIVRTSRNHQSIKPGSFRRY